MMTRYLLGIALAVASVTAACGDATVDTLGEDREDRGGSGRGSSRDGNDDGEDTSGTPGTPGTGTTGGTPTGGPSVPVPTNSPAGKAFYKANVHTFLSTKCGTCHGTAGPGPAWLTSADAEKSYGQLFQVGYVVDNSRIVAKGPHGGVANNILTAGETGTFNQWVAMELKDGGGKSTPNVLAKLGDCFDKTKFDAMQLGNWRTTRRTNNNNANNIQGWNENANNCTGCDNAPCTTCHSADAATGFVNAVGNAIFNNQPNYTFDETKLTNPAYITKYFGVSPEGKAIASDGIKKKGDATKLAKAYSHPMYTLTNNQQNALNAFVTDVVTRFNAGQCGK
jgi:hypothetical protein